MPSKKQRRREQKLRRHEYDWVLPNEEGEEVVVKPRELRAEKEAQKAAAKPAPAKGGRPARAPRKVPEPSWGRSAKRVGWIGPLFFVFVAFTGGKHKPSIAVALLYAIVLSALFIPVTYFIDRAAYRAYQKRAGRAT
jgi:hypothetical protein